MSDSHQEMYVVLYSMHKAFVSAVTRSASSDNTAVIFKFKTGYATYWAGALCGQMPREACQTG